MELVKSEVSKSYSGVVDADTSIEVGDSKDAARFYPQVKLLKWNNEVNLSVRFVTAEVGRDESSSTGAVYEKAVWNNTVVKAEFYGKVPDGEHPAGGFEFAVTLKSKPVSNVLSFSVLAKSALFVRQPPLTELIGQEGIVTATETEGFDGDGKVIVRRPENIVNSFAVYHAAPPKNIAGGRVYKTGKIGHIYRPKAIEAGGLETWCGMDYDEQSGVLSITVPQDFLDTALYPVVVDPTFGYTTAGGTATGLLVYPICHVGAGLVLTASGVSRITKFTIYGTGTTVDMAAYTVPAGTPVDRLQPGVAITLDGTPAWRDSAAIGQYMMNGVIYGCAVGFMAGMSNLYIDTGIGNQRSAETRTGALQTPWSHASFSSALYSMYATYETISGNMMVIQDE